MTTAIIIIAIAFLALANWTVVEHGQNRKNRIESENNHNKEN